MVIEFSDVQGGRAWSMTNFVPGLTDWVDFVIKMKLGGELSNFLFDSHGLDKLLDQSVRVFGPIGKAVFDENISRDLVCIAGGTGIASMMSILEAFLRKKIQQIPPLYFLAFEHKRMFSLWMNSLI